MRSQVGLDLGNKEDKVGSQLHFPAEILKFLPLCEAKRYRGGVLNDAVFLGEKNFKPRKLSVGNA